MNMNELPENEHFGYVGLRFVTPRGLVIEVLGEVDGELQCCYITVPPDGGGRVVDFTKAAVALFTPVGG